MRILLTLLCLFCLLAGACSQRDHAAEQSRQADVPMLTVGHVGHDHQIALYIAALQGERFIEQYGTGLRPVRQGEIYDLIDDGQTLARLRLVKVGGGSKMPAAMARGEIGIGLGGISSVARLADSQATRDVRIIAPLQADGDMLVLAADSPVNDWAGFAQALKTRDKPLVIGYKAPMATALLVLQAALDAEGLSWTTRDEPGAKVILQNMKGGKNAIPLMASGSIDGFVMNQPVVALTVDKGLGKVVADLRDLPPAGRWHDHPCCCVCATGEVIDNHPAALEALLKTIHIGTDFIARKPDRAAELAAEWIRTPPAVEKQSVPTIAYQSRPDATWRKGMETWAAMMQAKGFFTGRFKAMTPAEVVDDLCEMRFATAAAEQLRAAGHLDEEK
jgi:NitT/TauT family transport system substrate-binding protein